VLCDLRLPTGRPGAHHDSSTTDLHGNIYPIDYNTNKPDVRGLARVATVVKHARKETPDLLLLDSGDTIQGTPLTFHHAKVTTSRPIL